MTNKVKELPERINVMRVVSYDVEQIVNELVDSGQEAEAVTLEDVINFIESWVAEDLSCGYGHTVGIGDLIWQDENGEEL